MENIRKANFKIGCVHGNVFAKNRDSEAQLRNELFLIGMLKVEVTRKEAIDIRLVAYEMPLQTGQSRGRCIDLLGYDQNKKPWIIELKKKNSNEKIDQIKKQIDDYEDIFQKIREHVEAEIRIKFHWNEFKFSEGTGKLILAGREFFHREKSLENYKSLGIYCCSFSRIQNEIKDRKVVLLEKNKQGIINLKIHNK